MKSFTKIVYSALLLGNLALATSCEKATVEPEFSAATSTFDKATATKKGFDAQVTATLLSTGQVFTATLTVDSVVYKAAGPFGATVYAKSSLTQIAGLSLSDAATLSAEVFEFNILLPHQYYSYQPGSRDITNTFTFSIGGAGAYGRGKEGTNLVQLEMDYPFTVDAEVRKFKQVEDVVASLPRLWEPANNVLVNGVAMPTRAINGDANLTYHGTIVMRDALSLMAKRLK